MLLYFLLGILIDLYTPSTDTPDQKVADVYMDKRSASEAENT